MKDETVKDILKERISGLCGLAKKINSGFDEEDIHEFRTSTKHLRSFLRLLQSFMREKGVKLSKRYKQLYSVAGTIREAQLETASLQRRQLHLPAYQASLDKLIAIQKKKWKQQYDEKIFEKMKEKLCAYDYGTVPVKALDDFFREKINAIGTVSKMESPDDATVHNMRKNAKDILNTAKLAKKKWQEAHELLQKIPLKELDTFSDATGDYHDAQVEFDHIRSFASGDISNTEEKAIQDLCKSAAVELRHEKTRILDMGRQLAGGGQL